MKHIYKSNNFSKYARRWGLIFFTIHKILICILVLLFQSLSGWCDPETKVTNVHFVFIPMHWHISLSSLLLGSWFIFNYEVSVLGFQSSLFFPSNVNKFYFWQKTKHKICVQNSLRIKALFLASMTWHDANKDAELHKNTTNIIQALCAL